MIEFSVVIPLYNKENYILQTLESVLNQTYLNFEVIIVDDGSTDNGLDLVKAFDDKRVKVITQDNLGASIARNNGVKYAEKEWIAFLDADDIWYNNHLHELCNSIIKFPDAEVVSNAYEIQLSNKLIKKPNINPELNSDIGVVEDYFKSSLVNPLFWTSSLAIRKISFIDVDGFDPNIKSGQDTDLIIRLALKYKLIYNPKITFLHIKTTENNLSKSNMLEDRFKSIEKQKEKESTYSSLKTYLDINRFSLAMQAKLINDKTLYLKYIKDLDKSNLSILQNLVLILPAFVLNLFKKIQLKLIEKGIYKSVFNR